MAFLTDRFFGRAERSLPVPWQRWLTNAGARMRRDRPRTLSALVAGKRALALRRDFSAPWTYVKAVRTADLVVATGAGVFTDAFLENATGVLNTLDFARQYGIPSAVMGHGIGPVGNAALKQRMAEVLPHVALIAVRERRESVALLQSLGVAHDRIVVTGDDAIEMANARSRATLGNGIGVNVRVAGYAGTTGPGLKVIRPALQSAARRLDAPLVPVPIAHHPDCHDGQAISALTSGDGSEAQFAELNTPQGAIEQVSRCRVMVTGSYHAAVFALAQGIPVVGIAASTYYVNKFAGLADLFPGGCEVVDLTRSDALPGLEAAIATAWMNAPLTRGALLQAAAAQISSGVEAYRRLGSLMGKSARGTASPRDGVAVAAVHG